MREFQGAERRARRKARAGSPLALVSLLVTPGIPFSSSLGSLEVLIGDRASGPIAEGASPLVLSVFPWVPLGPGLPGTPSLDRL